ncbi:DUF6262 family protein [Clostridium kluyveri]|uniref:Transposase C from transposon Tn554 n=2 Tax=Clostridium kluyveri TaxID=1534 RepID=A5N901_CLOK5|nr:DUF6262 family protein [Clostridium kluyveri]EDK33782.1 Transposase C from transposon Tn554 [Clostridium kluyveri DSM 555]BAH06664.1 hypothetical protein CKR_1613 [Clostridium kluyveri NBRC 12016]
MPSSHVRNIKGLKEYAQDKKEEVTKRVDATIQKLIIEKKPINFNSVSIEANVSKTYLYTHKDVRKRIEELRVRQIEVFSSKNMKKQMTENNKDTLLIAKNKKIKELSEEVKRLKQELMYLQGKIYDKS